MGKQCCRRQNNCKGSAHIQSATVLWGRLESASRFWRLPLSSVELMRSGRVRGKSTYRPCGISRNSMSMSRRYKQMRYNQLRQRSPAAFPGGFEVFKHAVCEGYLFTRGIRAFRRRWSSGFVRLPLRHVQIPERDCSQPCHHMQWVSNANKSPQPGLDFVKGGHSSWTIMGNHQIAMRVRVRTTCTFAMQDRPGMGQATGDRHRWRWRVGASERTCHVSARQNLGSSFQPSVRAA